MKRNLLSSAVVLYAMLAVALPALAADAPKQAGSGAAVPPYIPAYPGARLTAEINFSDSDVLQTLKQAVAGLAAAASMKEDAAEPSSIDQNLKDLNVAALPEILSGLKQIRIVRSALPKGKHDAQGVLNYYDRALSKGGWTRIVYMAPGVGEAYSLYTLPSSRSFFAVGFDGKAGKNELFALRTGGFIDVEKAVAWALNASKVAEREKWMKKDQKPEEPAPAAQPEEDQDDTKPEEGE